MADIVGIFFFGFGGGRGGTFDDDFSNVLLLLLVLLRLLLLELLLLIAFVLTIIGCGSIDLLKSNSVSSFMPPLLKSLDIINASCCSCIGSYMKGVAGNGRSLIVYVIGEPLEIPATAATPAAAAALAVACLFKLSTE